MYRERKNKQNVGLGPTMSSENSSSAVVKTSPLVPCTTSSPRLRGMRHATHIDLSHRIAEMFVRHFLLLLPCYILFVFFRTFPPSLTFSPSLRTKKSWQRTRGDQSQTCRPLSWADQGPTTTYADSLQDQPHLGVQCKNCESQ